MHAILSLGATHLSLIVPSGTEYTVAAVAHRGHAFRGLSRMLAKDGHTREELDAMLATCYVLTFQARYMTDGLVDLRYHDQRLRTRHGALAGQALREQQRLRDG